MMALELPGHEDLAPATRRGRFRLWKLSGGRGHASLSRARPDTDVETVPILLHSLRLGRNPVGFSEKCLILCPIGPRTAIPYSSAVRPCPKIRPDVSRARTSH